MLYNILVIPLLSGYIFLTNCKAFTYSHKRLDRQRLIFHSAIAGLIFLISAFVIISLLRVCFDEYLNEIRSLIHFKMDYLGTSLMTGFLSLSATILINFFTNDLNQAKKVVLKYGSELDRVLYQSSEEDTPLLLSLDNKKVYVCLFAATTEPGADYITVLPLFSGYRDPVTYQVTFVTNYLDLYISEGDESDIPANHFDLILKLDSIVSATRFDPKIFGALNEEGETNASDE